MVRVKGGMRTDAKRTEPSEYSSYLHTREYKGISFFCSTASRLESGKYLVLLTAVARQCTVHRTLIMNKAPDKDKASDIIKKWIRKLPIDSIR